MVASVRDVLGTWNFAPQAARLYTFAMAWKGASIQGFRGDDDQSSEAIALEQAALLELLPGYLIDGRVAVRVVNNGDTSTLAKAIDGEPSFEIITPKGAPMDEPGRSVFESATANHENTLQMREALQRDPNCGADGALQTIRSEVLEAFSLPEWALNREQAANADVDTVIHGLNMFRVFVDDWRDGFGRMAIYGLRDWFSSQDPPITSPVCFWETNFSGDTGIAGLDGIYAAFRECGLPLTRFGMEFPARLRDSVRTLPLAEAREVLRSWEAMGL